MSDDFGLVNPVTPPLLERIEREEPLKRDQPRKHKDLRSKPGRKNTETVSPTDGNEQVNDSISSNHIDLRI